MRINRLRLDGLGLPTGIEPSRPEAARREPADSVGERPLHTPSPELVQWVRRAGREPEIRPAAVSRASERLAAGDYLTHASAEETAQAMLEAGV